MTKIFVSYSHKDEDIRKKLHNHLASMVRNRIIEILFDRKIRPGQHLDHEIEKSIAGANIVLLLVSANFINSNYCYNVELKYIMRMHRIRNLRVVPVIVSACDWKDTPFGNLLAVPTDGKPIRNWKIVDDALLDVVEQLKSVIEELKQSTPDGSNTPHDPIQLRPPVFETSATPPNSSRLKRPIIIQQGDQTSATPSDPSSLAPPIIQQGLQTSATPSDPSPLAPPIIQQGLQTSAAPPNPSRPNPPIIPQGFQTSTQKQKNDNLTVRKNFTDADRDMFLSGAFDYIVKHFESSLKKLESKYDFITTSFRQIDANKFTAVIYKNGSVESRCKVCLGGGYSKGITYSETDQLNDDSCTDCLSVEQDGKTMYLKSMMSIVDGIEKRTRDEAANYYWSKLIGRLQ